MITLETGQWLTTGTARVAAVLYVLAVALWSRNRSYASRVTSTLGLAFYVAHVVLAFHNFYGWSHSVAYRETARQTRELFGIDWGGGLYLNYLFTVLWSVDCAAAWVPELQHAPRITRARVLVHAFLAFMVLNATVVVWVLRAIRLKASAGRALSS